MSTPHFPWRTRLAAGLGWLLLAGCTGAPAAPPAAPSATPPMSPAPAATPVPGPQRVDGWHLFQGTASLEPPPGGALDLVLASTEGESALAVETGPATWRGAPWPVAPGPAPGPKRPYRQLQATESRAVGSEASFWINDGSFESEGDRLTPAVLRRITPHAYFYVDAAASVSESAIAGFAEAFEARILPRMTALFGPAESPGVDGEARIFIVFSPRLSGPEGDLLGYFWPRDAVPPEAATDPHSNGKEVLFMSTALFRGAPLLAHGALAHEYQHLLNFSRKGPRLGYRAKEATWLDEGLAMLAMDETGHGLHAGERNVAEDVAAFLARPEAYSLTDWAGNPNGYAFGQTFLFVRFLVDRHGEGVIQELIDTDQTGLAAVGEVLARRGETVEGFFRDWAIANALSGRPEAEGTPYRYATFDPHGSYGGHDLSGVPWRAPGALPGTLRPWSAAYARPAAGPVRVTGGDRLFGAALPRR